MIARPSPWLVGAALTASIALSACTRPKIAAYAAAAAKQHVGETAAVSGVVTQVLTVESRMSGSDNEADDSGNGLTAAAGALAQILPHRPPTQVLNFGGSYPNEEFAAVVFGADAEAVGAVTQYEGKRVTVTGVITLYRGRAQIIVRDARSLK